ncbi:MAG: hypothetical protein ACI8W8_004771 [Rhodothermales bacterium]
MPCISLGVAATAVVIEKHDNRIVGNAVRVQAIEDTANAAAHGHQHAVVDAAFFVFDGAELVLIGIECMHGRVNGIEGQVQKGGFGLIAIDELAGFGAPIAGEIFRRRKLLIASIDGRSLPKGRVATRMGSDSSQPRSSGPPPSYWPFPLPLRCHLPTNAVR